MKPSITKLIALLDKPALLKWANKLGLEGTSIDEYRMKKMRGGTDLHGQIEAYLKYKTPFYDQSFFKKFEKFMEDKEVLSFEQEVENDYFKGRLDIRLKFDDCICLCDFKSNNKKVYFEQILQLVGYRMIEPSDKLAIISIPDFKIRYIDVEDFTPYEQILINLSNIYKLKEEIENGKL